jgi:integrase
MPRPAGFFAHRGNYVTDSGGVRTILCPVSDGKKAAKEALGMLLSQRAEERRRGVTKPRRKAKTVVEVCDEFLDEKKIERRQATYEDYASKLQPLIAMFGQSPITELSKRDGIKYKEWLMNQKPWVRGKQAQKGLSSTSVNDYLRVARTMLGWAADEDQGYIDRNPWKKVSMLTERPRTRIITDAEFGHLLAQCRDGNLSGGAEDLRHILMLARYTGLRRREICLLTWEDFRHEMGQIVIPADRVKSHKQRTVTITSDVARVIEGRKARFERFGLELKGYVFPRTGKQGRAHVLDPSVPQDPDVVTNRVHRLVERCAKLGLIEAVKHGERISLHQARHTRITELHAVGLPLKTILEESGHTKLPTNLNYTHPSEESRVDAVRRLAGGAPPESDGTR